MLAISHNCRPFLYRTPCDMRFGIYSLAGLVRNELGHHPVSGDIFVFQYLKKKIKSPNSSSSWINSAGIFLAEKARSFQAGKLTCFK